ncbi:DUF3369 domain-containing protein [Zhongshania guokunii]|uniref:DUF3369 domain-containing protein n=1 Tax=Zhongshania guokunii TaxID=641783 RepID=A0ABV3U7K4_9GAMM
MDAIAVLLEPERNEHQLLIAAAIGKNQNIEGQETGACLPPFVVSRIREALQQDDAPFGDGYFSASFSSRHGLRHLVNLSCNRNFNVADQKLIDLFCPMSQSPSTPSVRDEFTKTPDQWKLLLNISVNSAALKAHSLELYRRKEANPASFYFPVTNSNYPFKPRVHSKRITS